MADGYGDGYQVWWISASHAALLQFITSAAARMLISWLRQEAATEKNIALKR